jgi:hypothetical protein
VGGWIYTNGEARLAEDEITAQEWAFVTKLVCEALPHRELEIDPWHCQICRNAVIVVAELKAGRDLPEALAFLAVTRAGATLGMFTPRTPDRPATAVSPEFPGEVSGDPVLPDDEFVPAVT